ncbi:lipoprotein [Pseudoalteromonas sp. A25]|uniref:DUF799 domain-containing protein n=1 Tax=Pseudoalteromonas sp. A25 TaxID=116092 RepID=UPI0012A2F683|nr:lipoprotein [Pseudoalteromonas sp. A25]
MNNIKTLFAFIVAITLSGCASKSKPYDYTEYKNSDPRSVLVVPPINNSSEVIAPYSLLSNVVKPLSESGYYVFPVSLVDETFKSNGLTVAQDIHAVPTQKLHEIFGADAGLYIDIKEYGTSYVVISSDTVVQVDAKLVDLETGTLLWQGSARAASSEQRSNSGGGLVGALVSAALTQIIETTTDAGFNVSVLATQRLLSADMYNGILHGPRSPKYGQPVKL